MNKITPVLHAKANLADSFALATHLEAADWLESGQISAILPTNPWSSVEWPDRSPRIITVLSRHFWIPFVVELDKDTISKFIFQQQY